MVAVRDDSTVNLAEDPPSGARAATLCLLVSIDGAFVTYPLPAHGAVEIGRAAGCAICIDHPSVSRRHARLQLAPVLEIEDLDSANGVRVQDRRLAPGQPAALRIGEAFEIGGCVGQVRRSTATLPPRAVSAEASPMGVLRELAERVAASQISILVLGETGVGKEVLARTLHQMSPRAAGTLLALHCAALPESLLESELFGHEKGAFTGAAAAKVGLLESAHGGTVFLDEIGELPLAIQVKLLRVIEERAVLPIGALRPRPIDVRFVAATHRDLEREVDAGRFRGDLYFRLNGVTLVVPPLRERTAEIGGLATQFIRDACARDRRATVPRLSAEALDRLRAHRWPGNVRELRNVIDRAVLLCRDDVIRPADLPTERGSERVIDAPASRPTAPSLPVALPDAISELHSDIQALERQRITEALERRAGNQKLAAKQLGISRNTLSARMDAFGFPRPRKSSRG